MQLVFFIKYYCKEGQKMFVYGSILELGQWQIREAKEMTQISEGCWILNFTLSKPIREIVYQYLLIDSSGNIIFEPCKELHHIRFDKNKGTFFLYDYWKLKPIDNIFYSSAFADNIFARENYKRKIVRKKEQTLRLKISCPYVQKKQTLLITGNQECLGKWNPNQGLELTPINFPEWEIELSLKSIKFPFEYKYVIFQTDNNAVIWESQENRYLENLLYEDISCVIVTEYPFRLDSFQWKGVGTVIPLFSLRSKRSFGIGDLDDLKLLIDWAHSTNQNLIQILPINDTTHSHSWRDSYPYSAISIYAIHPIYISLNRMNKLNDKKKKDYYEKRRKALNAKEFVDYDRVEKDKIRYLRLLFLQEGNTVLKSKEFQVFFQKNAFWLKPYAVFCYLRDKYETANYLMWGKHSVFNANEIEQFFKIGSEAYEDISYVFYVQFNLHNQLNKVSIYARQKGVVLKGDLPIGIHQNSVEVWMEPDYFNRFQQAGAPPDFFSNIGQNWSFPTYNWSVMEEDGYKWWKSRFEKISEYFDCLRIDHILGFFRIWEIPIDYKEGLCGHFRPALPLSQNEINELGLEFKSIYLKPVINKNNLCDIFGDSMQEVVETFLSPIESNYLTLAEFCDTQRKIEELFSNSTDELSVKIKKGLTALTNEILFIEDPYEENKYHPRIMGFNTFRYKELSDLEKIAFDKIHHNFFYERHNQFWKNNALKRLTPLVNATKMLICGEDLGMLPKTVNEVLKELDILSLELERTPKEYGQHFTDLQKVPYLSVSTTSTHDMSPLRVWWNEEVNIQSYYESVLHKFGLAPKDCTPAIAEEVIKNHLKASSIFTIIPLQDWFSIDGSLRKLDCNSERVNNPENPNHYWQYRIHLYLEDLIKNIDFNQKIKDLLTNSNRC